MTSLATKLTRLADLFGGNQNGAGLPLSNRNYIVDGNFESWLNSTISLPSSATLNSAATMYTYGQGGTGASTITLSSFAVGGEPIGMTSPAQYALYWNQTTAGNAPFILQKIEGVRTLQGRSSTFSCWLQCSTGGPQVVSNIIVRQVFGTGGSPSVTVSADTPVNWTITSSWQRFSVRIDWPSIAGKFIGSNSDDCLWIGIALPTGTLYQMFTTQWQLEQTSANAPATGLPTAFEYRGLQAEQARWERYYQQGQCNFTGYGAASQLAYMSNPLIVPMRTNPVCTQIAAGAVSNCSAPSATATAQIVQYQTTVTATGASGTQNYRFSFDARL